MKRLVIDFETGGLDVSKHSALSFGAVIVDNDSIVGEYYALIRENPIVIDGNEPRSWVRAGATETNGLTTEFLEANGQRPAEVVREFEAFLLGHGALKASTHFNSNNRIVPVGYNLPFDVGFLKRLYRLAGNEWKYEAIMHHRGIDLAGVVQLLMDAGFFSSLNSTASNKVFDYFGVTPKNPHHALEDAVATAKLYLELKKIGKFMEVYEYGQPRTTS